MAVDRRALPWVGAAVIAAHNLEEALLAPAWLHEHSVEINVQLARPVPHFSAQGLYVALAVVTLVSLVWIAGTFRSLPRTPGAYSLVVLFGMYFINAFVPHILGALVLRAYIPGLLTASFAVVPYTILFVSVGVRAEWYTRRGIGVALAVALGLYACAGIGVQWSLAASRSTGA